MSTTTPATAPADVVVLPPATWRAAADAHAARADALTAGHRARRSRHERHAIEDFLYEYYPTRPAQLRRWHPGVGVALAPDADGPAPHTAWRWYRTGDDGTVTLDVPAFLAARGDAVRFVAGLVGATASRPTATGCFGLHEWAMVYREDDGEHRHPLPLRLGRAGTDAVVEGHRIRCTHVDAFRFFTPAAVPRNTLQPTRATQVALEQPGCLHANMDVYKWCLKLGPAVPGDLVLDAFELAREIRLVDMRASPYDVRGYDLDPIAIETPDGKADYVRRQRAFAVRANALRSRLLAVCEALPAA
ncbi:3-methyladenine DNA glycosylase [Cellulomonas shaoxiangyii]|uniref:3-methyladenine DNA glycosylase n=1 Tax=Cellulomonas shaoxiangyii TaxID=2566013 RepID=A0A4P7SNK4_9CELL|nr:3-methyladenine DNA glycosylase [Cellulomonas shaoxiangyii]QCB94193.1 3-methyladenine DNA glycosylase [Cellulomonas shaoxiangyii]TGY86686.1 3-methyladenine DNA glycosylase [Cellulomonas shaoxiangyii]